MAATTRHARVFHNTRPPFTTLSLSLSLSFVSISYRVDLIISHVFFSSSSSSSADADAADAADADAADAADAADDEIEPAPIFRA